MIKVQPAQNIKDGIQNLINASIEDYNSGTKLESMKEEFANSWVVKEGPKYIKIIRQNAVHAFIVKEDFKHFVKGDVLKPASWSKPALNAPRGNVLKGNYPMCWTGPLYLN